MNRWIVLMAGLLVLPVGVCAQSAESANPRELPVLFEDGRLDQEGEQIYEAIMSAVYTDNPPPKKRLLNKRKERQANRLDSDTDGATVGNDQMLRQTAHYVSARRAFRFQYGRIMSTLKNLSGIMDTLYDFSALMIRQHDYEQGIVPPVISKVNQSVKYEEDKVVSTEATWRITRRASVRSNPPDWRQYLMRPLPDQDEINPARLPRNKREARIWREAVHTGWSEGIEHARRVFDRGLNRLVRDYNGMMRFRILAARNMISVPRLDRTKRGIRVRGRQLDLDQRVFKLKMPAEFKPMMDLESLSGPIQSIGDGDEEEDE